MLKITNLSKSFFSRRARRSLTVFSGLNLELKRGEFLTVKGANGAGKTTLLRIISTLLTPDDGAVLWDGGDIFSNQKHFKKICGYVSSEENSFYGQLTGAENLNFFSKIYDKPISAAVKNLSHELNLDSYMNIKFCYYSKGTKQKLAFLRGVLGECRLLLVDELDALDEQSAGAVAGHLRMRAEDGAIIVATSSKTNIMDGYATKTCELSDGKLK